MSDEAFTGLVMSGTVLAIQRHTEEAIRVTIRDTKGLVYEVMFPFAREHMSRPLPFNVDDLVGVSISKVDTILGASQ